MSSITPQLQTHLALWGPRVRRARTGGPRWVSWAQRPSLDREGGWRSPPRAAVPLAIHSITPFLSPHCVPWLWGYRMGRPGGHVRAGGPP